MTTHTPGPWNYESEDNIIYSADGMRLIDVSIVPRSIHVGLPQRKANGRLAASAPELLDALERITSSYRLLLSRHPVRDASETLAEADAAIAKATGA